MKKNIHVHSNINLWLGCQTVTLRPKEGNQK